MVGTKAAYTQSRHALAVANNEESDDDGSSRQSAGAPVLVADKKPLVLDKNGAATLTLDKLPASSAIQQLTVEATYSDPNGEVQPLSQVTPVWNSAVVLGIKTEAQRDQPAFYVPEYLQRAGIEVVNLLMESRQQPDIIEFGEARQRSENR